MSEKKRGVKIVILVGGPSKGTRFRPLSLDIPKPLFPIAGRPIIAHHIDSCLKLSKKYKLSEILLLGFFKKEKFSSFCSSQSVKHGIKVRYCEEPDENLGTGGGLVYFKKDILDGMNEKEDLLIVFNGDVACSFPLDEMIKSHLSKSGALCTILSQEVDKKSSFNFGCLVIDPKTKLVNHYVEKPTTYISNTVNCGVYCFSLSVVSNVFELKSKKKDASKILDEEKIIKLEQDILVPLSETDNLYAYMLDKSKNFWYQLKTAGSVIQCSNSYIKTNVKDVKYEVIGKVHINSTATIHPTAKIGPNATIGANVTVGAGVRIKDSVILSGCEIKDRAFINYSIIGWNSTIGKWSRVQGSPNFSQYVQRETEDKITIIGKSVIINNEITVIDSIVLPNKKINKSTWHRIIL